MLQVSVSSAVMVTSPPRGAQSIVMSMSVCLSVHQRNSKTKYLIFTIFFCAHCQRPCLGRPPTALQYIMYFRFCGRHVFIAWGQWARIKHDAVFRCISMNFTRWQHQLDVEQPVFCRVHQNAAPGAKSAIHDCLYFLLIFSMTAL